MHWSILRARAATSCATEDPRKCLSTFIAYVRPLVLLGKPEQMQRGISLMISRDVRRIPDFSIDARAKNTNRGDLTRGFIEARDAGFDNVLLQSYDGYVTEGPFFNVLAVIKGELVSPDENVLGGISARTLMELAPELGLAARYGKLTPEELYSADEVFITSTSSGGLIPVTKVDNTIYGNGRPGPYAVKLVNLYYRKKNAGWRITPIDYSKRK